MRPGRVHDGDDIGLNLIRDVDVLHGALRLEELLGRQDLLDGLESALTATATNEQKVQVL